MCIQVLREKSQTQKCFPLTHIHTSDNHIMNMMMALPHLCTLILLYSAVAAVVVDDAIMFIGNV